MAWSPPQKWAETQVQLKRSGQVTLNAAGQGVLIFTPNSARTRWLVTTVVVSTNQPAAATVVPVATLAVNTVSLSTMSPGNSQGASWSGNQDVFSGEWDVGACDFVSVLFSPPPGSTGAQIAQLAGVIASAVVSGQAFTRRA
jgi:hypothetical protein